MLDGVTEFLVTYLSIALAMFLLPLATGRAEAFSRLRTRSSRFCWLAGCAIGSLLWPMALACVLFPSIMPRLFGLAARAGGFFGKIFRAP